MCSWGRKAERQPDCVADDFGRKAKALVVGSKGVCFYEVILAYCSVRRSGWLWLSLATCRAVLQCAYADLRKLLNEVVGQIHF